MRHCDTSGDDGGSGLARCGTSSAHNIRALLATNTGKSLPYVLSYILYDTGMYILLKFTRTNMQSVFSVKCISQFSNATNANTDSTTIEICKRAHGTRTQVQEVYLLMYACTFLCKQCSVNMLCTCTTLYTYIQVRVCIIRRLRGTVPIQPLFIVLYSSVSVRGSWVSSCLCFAGLRSDGWMDGAYKMLK